MIKIESKAVEELTEFICSGDLSVDEIRDAIESFYSDKPTRNVLWDFTDANVSSIRAQDVRGTAIFTREKAHSRTGGKTALVGTGDASFGIGRMYQSFAELARQETEIQIFRSREEAMVWIAESE